MRHVFELLEEVGAILRRRNWWLLYWFSSIQTCAWHVVMYYLLLHSQYDARTPMLAWLAFTAVCNVVSVVIIILTEVFV